MLFLNHEWLLASVISCSSKCLPNTMWGNISFQQSLIAHFGEEQTTPSSAAWWLTTSQQLSRGDCLQPVRNPKPPEPAWLAKTGKRGGSLSTSQHTTHPSRVHGTHRWLPWHGWHMAAHQATVPQLYIGFRPCLEP